MKITPERLRQLVKYDPKTGVMTWLMARPKCSPGTRVGRLVKGRRQVFVEGRYYYVSVLAVVYMTGVWPVHDVDHRSRDKADDRWDNLRQATRSQNKANVQLQSNNKLRLKGVSWSDRDQIYSWSVKCGDIRVRGSSHCPAAAHFSYVVEANKLFGEFAYGGT